VQAFEIPLFSPKPQQFFFFNKTISLCNNSILGYKVSKCIITESRKSLKFDEVEIFQLPRFCYGTYPTTFFAQSLIRKKGLQSNLHFKCLSVANTKKVQNIIKISALTFISQKSAEVGTKFFVYHTSRNGFASTRICKPQYPPRPANLLALANVPFLA
jgi:hypothetical protein